MEIRPARSIFSAATGFIRRGGYDWTCNPYIGCTYACSYCYAMFLPQNRRPLSEWGRWLVAKANAVALAQRFAPKVAGQAIYMASVTDPYLPAERTLRLSRGILEALIPYQPRLTVQTRSPLVVRDIDLLRQFRYVGVNLSITTDCEEIRRCFEPKAPPLEERWAAARSLRQAGISITLCITPTLPLRDPEAFARLIAAFGPEVVVVQDFEESHGCFGADTGPRARQLLKHFDWTADHYYRFRDILQRYLKVYEGEAGFFPPGPRPSSDTTTSHSPPTAQSTQSRRHTLPLFS
ncbi:MAG: radical SAM protein [Gemmataceae bacterium]|nr:radical SAM protein [Gemmataceae bacterium]MCS7269994.1 radical SAM protein [Gemmataceae bacterium]MDW8244491.1 radical SAM protein [Thermogemmata sp.]